MDSIDYLTFNAILHELLYSVGLSLRFFGKEVGGQ